MTMKKNRLKLAAFVIFTIVLISLLQIASASAADIGPAIYVDESGNVTTMDETGKETILGGISDAFSELTSSIAVDEYGNIVTMDETGEETVIGSIYNVAAMFYMPIIVDEFGNVFEVDRNGNENLVYYIDSDISPVWVTLDGVMMTMDDSGASVVVEHVDLCDMPVPMAPLPSLGDIPAFSITPGTSVQDIDGVYVLPDKLVLSSKGNVAGLCDLSLFNDCKDELCGALVDNTFVTVKNHAAGVCGHFPCLVVEADSIITITIG